MNFWAKKKNVNENTNMNSEYLIYLYILVVETFDCELIFCQIYRGILILWYKKGGHFEDKLYTKFNLINCDNYSH